LQRLQNRFHQLSFSQQGSQQVSQHFVSQHLGAQHFGAQVSQQVSQQSWCLQRLHNRVHQLSFSQQHESPESQQVGAQLVQAGAPHELQPQAPPHGTITGAATGSAPASQALVSSRNAAFMNSPP
jgi:hypothetical protein